MILCGLSVHELYHATLILNLRRYRDFVTKLPLDLSLKILSYLTPKDIVNASEVSKDWHDICTSDVTWNIKCVQHAVPPNNPEELRQQELYKNNILLKDNWKNGRCRVNCFSGSQHKMVSVAYDTKTGKIATGMVNGEIKIWNLSKSGGALIATLISHTKSVWGVEWFKGNCLISCSSDGTIKIWNVKKGLCQKSIEAHEGKIWTIKCETDVIFSGSDDKSIKCWDIKRCEVIQTYSGHNGSIFCLDLNGSDQLLSGSADKTVRIWDRHTGECMRCIWVTHTNPGWVMGLSVSQGHVACCHNDKVTIYHINTGVLVKTVHSHSDAIESVQMEMKNGSKNPGTTLVTCSKDKTIHYWELDKDVLHKLEGHKDTVHKVVFTSTRIVSVSADCTLKIWKFAAPNQPNIRRKTLISGGQGQLYLYEYHYDENVQYESEETKLYKKHLTRRFRQRNKLSGSSSDLGSREILSSLSDCSMSTGTSITPVEIASH